ncbi:hypothetical protein GC173_13795 [bacterium]|nr:hypothetical protein [bacterium]
MRRLLFFLLMVLCSGLLMEASAEERQVIPQMPLSVEYKVQRRIFLNEEADLGTSPTLALEEQQRDARNKGYLKWGNDPETGIFYGERLTTGSFQERAEGNFEYREFITVPGLRPGDMAVQQIRQLDVPIGTEPMLATNVTMALHPLGLIAPRLESLRKLLAGESVPLPRVGVDVVETPKWRFEMKYDPETGAPSEIRQFKRQAGGLVRRTRYEGWHPDPRTKRWVPTSVTSRTFRGLESLPLVELQFTDIRDMEAVPSMVIEAREKSVQEAANP